MTTRTAIAIHHLIVYQEPGRFCGWPANHGVWMWGDEILVGFERAYYALHEQEHSIRRDLPSEMRFARSLDAGETWKLDGEPIWSLEKPSAITWSGKEPIPLTQAIDFLHPDFVMKSFGTKFIISYDRGKQWQGPYALPDFGKELTTRTDYRVEGSGNCFLFLSAKEPKVQAKLKDRAFCMYTADGGLSFQLRGHMTGEPIAVRSVMPSTVRGTQGQLISALRRRHDVQGDKGLVPTCWIDLYHSQDDGYTWEFLSKVADTGDHNGNPPSLVRLRDGRLCVAYGYRREPFGMRAKLSLDEGRSWGEEIVLRADGRTWDIGYPRMVQRSDGKLVTMYYYTTAANPEQHIAASIWDPNQLG
jgi:hypothetical protein